MNGFGECRSRGLVYADMAPRSRRDLPVVVGGRIRGLHSADGLCTTPQTNSRSVGSRRAAVGRHTSCSPLTLRLSPARRSSVNGLDRRTSNIIIVKASSPLWRDRKTVARSDTRTIVVNISRLASAELFINGIVGVNDRDRQPIIYDVKRRFQTDSTPELKVKVMFGAFRLWMTRSHGLRSFSQLFSSDSATEN